VLAGLPDPDRIFIGGSGGRLAEIIRTCSDRLANGGRIVINAVTEPTRNNAPILLHEAGLNVSVSNISISRYGYPGDESGQKTFNPISVMVGKK
jgi:precorrin-6Y C5,15-methyltransferase (decarboxylating)